MKPHTLGPAWQSFGPNIRITLALLAIGMLFSWLAYGAAHEFGGIVAWTIFYFLSVGFGLLVARHLFFRLWVHDLGISYRTILGYGEVRWRELDRIYFGSYDIHVHYIALGTFYRLILVTQRGAKLSVGERLHDAKDLAELIQRYTIREMVRKAAREFANGLELDFGAIRMSRQRGLVYRKWFGQRGLRLEDMASYEVTDSYVKFRRRNKRLNSKIRSEKVANIHVLKALLCVATQILGTAELRAQVARSSL